MASFSSTFEASSDCIKVSEDLLSVYTPKIPNSLLDIWRNSGFGKYGNGIIELINPKEYESLLWTSIGKKADNYVPFAISAFGELFYYRKLTENDEDICYFDIQFKEIVNLTWSADDFFTDFFADGSMQEEWLRLSRFNTAVKDLGILKTNEIYTFIPYFALGGSEESSTLKIGNAIVYIDLLLQFYGIERWKEK